MTVLLDDLVGASESIEQVMHAGMPESAARMDERSPQSARSDHLRQGYGGPPEPSAKAEDRAFNAGEDRAHTAGEDRAHTAGEDRVHTAGSNGSNGHQKSSITEPADATELPVELSQMLDEVDDLARVALEDELDLAHIIEDHGDGWSAVVSAIRKRRFPHDPENSADPFEMYHKLISTIPSELRPDFRRFTQSRAVEEILERDAAFELGRGIERMSARRKSHV